MRTIQAPTVWALTAPIDPASIWEIARTAKTHQARLGMNRRTLDAIAAGMNVEGMIVPTSRVESVFGARIETNLAYPDGIIALT